MKKIFTTVLGIILCVTVLSQVPQSFSYQAVLRNIDGTIKANESVSVQIEILQGSIDGTTEYLEIHSTTTNSMGLIILEIGSGTTSDDLSLIHWSNGPYFLDVSVNGTNLGASQLQSVPYALHSRTAETVTGEITITETDPTYTAWDKSTGISITESQITDLQDYLNNEVDPAFASWNKASGIVITESQISDLQTYLTSETDPAFTSWDKSTGISITESQITDLQDYLSSEVDPAFASWDKATGIVITESQITDLQSYLTSETDPTYTAWDKSTGISITENQITDLQNYLTTEVDPAFASWDKATGIVITESQISDLQTYLTSETDPVYTQSQAANITVTDITNLTNLSGTNTGDQDGSETKVSAGTNITVTGTGTSGNPYIVNGATHYIGELYGGGIIFWVSPNGLHGLIASLDDLDGGSGVTWSDVTSTEIGASSKSMTDGASNTTAIIARQTSTSAAQLCRNLGSEWYLPSIRELYLLASQDVMIDYIFDNDGDGNTNGFSQEDVAPTYGRYWSSTEGSSIDAWFYIFSFGNSSSNIKSNTYRVRAVRAF